MNCLEISFFSLEIIVLNQNKKELTTDYNIVLFESKLELRLP